MKRALLSLHDKTGLAGFAAGLDRRGVEIVASGGTAAAVRALGIPVTPVESLTGYPELLGGRVKTLHPAIHGGILARRTAEHRDELARHGLAPIDLVACNLYPFQRTVADPAVSEDDAIEQIDIGGVTLLRAAAKNFASVVVVCDPADYAAVLDGTDLDLRRRLALKAFRHTAAYDAAIAAWFARDEGLLPEALGIGLERALSLRYGENPHQRAALYVPAGEPAPFEVLGGKDLSYNNLLDLAAALPIPAEFGLPAVAILKHNTPCGVAAEADLGSAFAAALACDPVSAFGSVVAVNRPVDEAFVEALGKLFVEVLSAPDFAPGALELLGRRKKNCRVVRPRAGAGRGVELRSFPGGVLVQTPDDRGLSGDWRVVTARAPTAGERRALEFGWLVVKHVKSNAIVLAQGTATVGIGGGETNRVDAVRLATGRAGERARGAAMASDAFFPFADGLEAAATAGVTAVVEPGGSVRDDDVIAAADRLGVAMLFTGERHFRH